MSSYQIDLHIHTAISDGCLSPKQIVELAIQKGMKAIAITDHDSLKGIEEAEKYANRKIRIIPGIEITCSSSMLKNKDIHILGLFINHKNKELNELVKKVPTKKSILGEISKNINNLLFNILVKNKKDPDKFVLKIIAFLSNRQACLKKIARKLLGRDKKISVRKRTPMEKAIKAIKSAEGISILAHPAAYGENSKIIDEFISYEGEGIEANYPYECLLCINKKESTKLNQKIRKISEEKHLLISGGSDFHKLGEKSIGEQGITESEFEKLRRAI